MKISPDEHVFYTIMNANINEYPYPHMLVQNIFDTETYKDILENLPDDGAFETIANRPTIISYTDEPPIYQESFVINMAKESFSTLPEKQKDFWMDFSSWFLGSDMMSMLLNKFTPFIQQRFNDACGKSLRVGATGLITRDKTGFSIGPHTDTDQKVLTLLFYLPKDFSQLHLGTTIYVPKDPNFLGKSGMHYEPKDFKKVFTAPFEPNSLFCFMKTKRSFHGVEIIENENIERNLLIYNIPLAD